MITHRTFVRTAAVTAMAAIAGLAAAPSALAGPAPTGTEVSYLMLLPNAGYNIQTSQQAKLAVNLGYLTCALDQIGGQQTSRASATILADAQTAGLCDYVSVNGQATQAQLKQDAVRQTKLITNQIQMNSTAEINQNILDHWNSDGIPDYLQDGH